MIHLNSTTILGVVIALVVVFLAHRMFMRPKLILAPYQKKKHIRTLIRSRLLPTTKPLYQDALTKGDFFHEIKQMVAEDPDLRAIVTVNGTLLVFNLTDPELLKEFFKQSEIYNKMIGKGLLKKFLQDGLFSSEGSIWKKHRKIDSQAFHFEFIKSQTTMVRNISKEFISQVDPTQRLPAINFFQSITGEIVCKTFFGSALANQKLHGKTFSELLADLMGDIMAVVNSTKHILFGDYYVNYFPDRNVREIKRRMYEFKQICRDMIAERKKLLKSGELSGEAQSDLLHYLLKYQEENPDDNFSDEEILHEFLTFFVAGLDTTGHLLGMATYYIARTPGVKERLNDEIKKMLPTDESFTDLATINKLEYVNCVLNETLRMAGPAASVAPRQATKAHMLGDLVIPKGATVMPAFFANNYNSKHYDKPYEFRPDRWVSESGKILNKHPQHPYIFTPFSTGPRNCIGQNMAMMEAKIILAEFMTTFDFEVPEDYKLRMTRRFLYEPVDELQLIVHKL